MECKHLKSKENDKISVCSAAKQQFYIESGHLHKGEVNSLSSITYKLTTISIRLIKIIIIIMIKIVIILL